MGVKSPKMLLLLLKNVSHPKTMPLRSWYNLIFSKDKDDLLLIFGNCQQKDIEVDDHT